MKSPRNVGGALRAYPDYKPSGVEWLGNVPAHWNIMPLKRIGRFSSGTGFPVALQGNLNEEILFVKVSDMNRPGNECRIAKSANTVSWQTSQNLGAEIFPAGAIVFPKVGGALLTNKRRLLVQETCIDNNLMGCIVTGADTDFIFRMLGYLDLARIAKPGPVPAISEGEVREIRVTIPPLAEQKAIVRYLDYADGRIGRYIRGKEKLVALLAEEKQAVIHQAVTRGLDPNVRLKPSGVEWLGDVPAHWEVLALKRLGWFRSGSGFPIGEQGQQNEELPFFKVSDMNLPDNERIMTICNNSISHRTAAKLGAPVFPSGTIIFPKVGGALLTNKRRVVGHQCCIDNNLMGCIVRHGNPEFILRLLERLDLATIAKPGPVPAISEGEIREIRTVLPPLAEQAAIAAYLDRETVRIDAAVVRARRQIELMREYRERLISDVVTGKLDVRGAVASLPDGGGPSGVEV